MNNKEDEFTRYVRKTYGLEGEQLKQKAQQLRKKRELFAKMAQSMVGNKKEE